MWAEVIKDKIKCNWFVPFAVYSPFSSSIEYEYIILLYCTEVQTVLVSVLSGLCSLMELLRTQ